MREESVFIPSDSILLEGLMNIDEALSIKKGAVVCHPHPQYGGDMDNSVVTALVEIFSEEGFSTLRFNFRGVGKSGGSYSEGTGEKEDVKAAIRYLTSRLDAASPCLMSGYSFGAWAGLSIAVEDQKIESLIAVAPPLEMYDFEFFKSSRKKKLVIVGGKDDFCPPEILKEWYKGVEEPKSLAIIPGADHFFLFHTQLLAMPIKEFLKK